MRINAFNRKRMSDKSRELVSLNSAKAQLYSVSMLDGSLLIDIDYSITIRTIPASFFYSYFLSAWKGAMQKEKIKISAAVFTPEVEKESKNKKGAKYIGCNERTVRRALKSNGVIKSKWVVKLSRR
uniref:Uncharacterized protein n=1 Tax=Microbotryum lychnidis-dioicae TaxID=288795 RepID=M1GLW3_9BASI|nr:hypothetical protein H911_mgp30 [Microbotryum lychnidis-dioicae]AGE14587.1 hypothetical protein [Microbotryum lychnidis-dioicae]